MHASILTLLAAASASLVAASPVKRATSDDCSAYPWFLAPYYASGCTGTPATYEPNSGPETSTPNDVTCQPIYQPGTTPVSFPAVSVNPDACPDQTYTILLYTTADCSDTPATVTAEGCVEAPSTGNFTMFSSTQ